MFLVNEGWTIPHVEKQVHAVSGEKFLSVFYVQSAYHQIPIAPAGKHKAAFLTSYGKYVFKRLPIELMTAPWVFAGLMDQIIAHLGPQSGLLTYVEMTFCVPNHGTVTCNSLSMRLRHS